MLPEETYADPAALSESTETKPLFAVDVCEHKGEILPHLTLGNPGKDRREICSIDKTNSLLIKVYKTRSIKSIKSS